MVRQASDLLSMAVVFEDKSPICPVAILTWVAYAGDGRHLLRGEALDATSELKRRCGLQNIFNLGMIASLGRPRDLSWLSSGDNESLAGRD
jgi:hypothetical protein